MSARDYRLAGRTVLRLTRSPEEKIHRPITLLRAWKGGASVLKDEVGQRPYRWFTLICGVLVNTRWGAVMVQWRGFGT